jgi:hypothetical protein
MEIYHAKARHSNEEERAKPSRKSFEGQYY